MKKIIMTVAAALAAGVFAMPAGFTDDFDAALKKAAAENKTVFALFTGSDWCIWCKRLEGEVLSQKAFSDEVGKTFVPVFLDFPSNKALVKKSTLKRNCELAEKYDKPDVLLEFVDEDNGYRNRVILALKKTHHESYLTTLLLSEKDEIANSVNRIISRKN